MSTAAEIAVGAIVGLALGILVSATTDVPLAPELGLVLGGGLTWIARRNRA
jgi:large-conductance mechanosensitive channel